MRSAFSSRGAAPSAAFLILCACLAGGLSGCGLDLGSGTSLFFLPIEVNGEPVAPGIVDTGGAYELMLDETFGLEVTGSAEVLVFSGPAIVGVTESFRAVVADVGIEIDNAIVGLDLCECNGIGFLLLRKAGRILHLDFRTGEAALLESGSDLSGLTEFRFLSPPAALSTFDTAFLEVTVTGIDGAARSVLALVDTGTTTTLMRRGLVRGGTNPLDPDVATVRMTADGLGTAQAQVRLVETEGLPDLVLGVDVMRAWSDVWAFRYDPVGGALFVQPRVSDGNESAAAARSE